MAVEMQAEQQAAGMAGDFQWANFRLPPFPETALRAMKLVNDNDASTQHFSELIAADPALSCEVLIIANSALLAQRHRVTSILQAILLLGTRTLKGVCLTVAVRAYLGTSMDSPMLRAIWRHSLACALIAEQLAGTSGMDQGVAYTGGVIHELGQFAMAVLRPKAYAALLETHASSAARILRASAVCLASIIARRDGTDRGMESAGGVRGYAALDRLRGAARRLVAIA